MPDHVFKLVEVVGTSTTTVEDAVNNGIDRTRASLHNLRWVEVGQIRGELEGDKIAHWQVTMKIGFRVDEEKTP